MDVILLERVEKLGQIGDVVTVKTGFARNYLLPRKKALRANAANKKLFEANRAQIEADNANRRVNAEKEAVTLDDKTLVLIRQASNTGQLYGSVSTRDVSEALAEDGIKIAKSAITLARPIKTIGVHEVKVVLHADVTRSITVNVARSPEEAELQAQGVNVMESMFERDEAGFTEDYDPNAEPGEIPAEFSEAAEEASEEA